MTTDTTERGLERLIYTALTGHSCDPSTTGTVGEPAAGFSGVGWSCGNPHDYDREYCVESVEQQKASQRAHLAELDTLFASLQSRAFKGDL